jgi:hypothetical protein
MQSISQVKPSVSLSPESQRLPSTAGGYAVLKGIQKAMRLPASNMLPSFAALRE